MSKKTFSLDNGLSPHLLLRDVFKYVIKMDETGECCITKYDFAHGATGARKTTPPFRFHCLEAILYLAVRRVSPDTGHKGPCMTLWETEPHEVISR